MDTVQQNDRFTLFSSKFLSIYFILYGHKSRTQGSKAPLIHKHKVANKFVSKLQNTVLVIIIYQYKIV